MPETSRKGPERPGVVIGYGSIGRRHARILEELCSSLAIINRRGVTRARALQEHPNAFVVEDLEALDDRSFPWSDALAVIATWGPSHSDFFFRLADRGVRHVLCEKPMAVSVAQAAAMARRAEEAGISLAVNHALRYADLVPALRRFLTLHDLGEPLTVVVSGGAACLVTNGVHWIDFATELFGDDPKDVCGFVRGEPINPRSNDLLYFGGSAAWSFSGDREAVIVLSNSSSLEPVARVYLPEALVDLSYESSGQDVFVRAVVRRSAGGPQGDFVSERAETPEPIFEGRLPGVRLFLEAIRAAMDDVLCDRGRRSPARAGVTAVSSVIGALWSGREGKSFPLPIDPASPLGETSWPIS